MDEQTTRTSVAGGAAPACSRGFDVLLAPADKDISRDNDVLCMSFVTFAELLKAAEGSTRMSEVLRRLEEITQLVHLLYPDGPSICVHYAAHATRLRAAGTPIGGDDLWIASHAPAESATLVTNDMGEFGRINGLVLENWVA